MANPDKLTIGTRGSQLALYQANKVKDVLEQKFPQLTVELKIIKTRGDKILDVALSKIGDKGLFTKELEVELLEGTIDLAVHSLKDLPTRFPEGLTLGGVLQRGEYRDALVHVNGKKFNELDETDVVATSSLRRRAQLLRHNPSLKIVDIRGNVNTRLQKMKDGHCTAMIMAAAGLQRLGLDEYITEILESGQFIPAVSQGAIAIQIRENDEDTSRLIQSINDEPTLIASEAERTFLRLLEGGCQVPIGCYSCLAGEKFYMKGFVSNLDGSVWLEEEITGTTGDSQLLARKLATALLEKGSKKILDEIRDQNQTH